MRSRQSGVRQGQRGVTLIWVTVFLMAMLMFIALGVDMAKLMTTRSQLQNAADAAALAGAGSFCFGDGTESDAKSRAIATGGYNDAFRGASEPVVINDGDIFVEADSQRVTVTARRDASTGGAMVVQFLQVLGIHTFDVSATATAKCEGGCHYVPFAVQPPTGQTFELDSTYLIKNAPPSGVQGSYNAIQYPPCPQDPCQGQGGAAQYLCWITKGYPCCDNVKVGDCMVSETGNMSGPTTSGIQFLIDTDSDSRLGIYYDRTHTDPNAYHGNGLRVVMAPLTGPVGPGTCGNKSYTVIGLGVFFLTRYATGSGANNTVYAQYIGTPDQLGMSNTGYTVRLVR